MGRLIVEQIVTADGFAADSDGGMKFIPTTVTDDYEIDTEQLDMLRTVDAIVLGATTYRMFADYWPTASVADDPVAEPINRLPKHVVSNTLDRAPWGDGEITVERGDGVASVRALLDRYAGDVIVWGSLTLADALLAAGAVDVLRLRVVPRLIGSGRGISPAGLAMTDLTLTATHSHASGQVTLQYDVAPTSPTAG
jgi:dihydrofolate reductase